MSANEDYGIFDHSAKPCDHGNAHILDTCTICPTCQAFTPTVPDIKRCYVDLLNEVVNVSHFDSANLSYIAALEEALDYVKRLADV